MAQNGSFHLRTVKYMSASGKRHRSPYRGLRNGEKNNDSVCYRFICWGVVRLHYLRGFEGKMKTTIVCDDVTAEMFADVEAHDGDLILHIGNLDIYMSLAEMLEAISEAL